jgi:hypothetical protein
MAARPHLSTVPNTPLSNRNTDDEDAIETRLPRGRCNFTNLNVGGNAPTCGCRRFWDKTRGARSGFGQGNPQWVCVCDHHACFHDDAPESQTGRASSDVTMTEGIQRLSTIPQTPPRQDASVRSRTRDSTLVGRPQESNLPDTLQWSRYINSGSSSGVLPAIPSQCLLPSENGSITTSGSQAGYSRPFGGLGLGTLSHIPKPGSAVNPVNAQSPAQNPRMQVYEDANGNAYLQSLTEVATPSVRSQDLSVEPEFGKNIADLQFALENLAGKKELPNSAVPLRMITKESMSQVIIKQSESHPEMDSLTAPNTFPKEALDSNLIPRLQYLVKHIADFPTKIENHEHRLDSLENASFSNSAIEELREVDDRLDTRVDELEDRLLDVEKAQAALNDASSVGSRHHVDGSFSSRMSNSSSAMIASAMDRVDASRVEALEAQVAELQAAAQPSYAHPWEVEVVFLPFGSRLMGIWSSQYGMTQRSRLNSTATDDWTQPQHNSLATAQACLTAHDQASAWEKSATDLRDQDQDPAWLMAKACGVRTRVDERLRSRGFVKLVQVCGPDARDVQAAILTAFGDLPSLLIEDPYSHRADENVGVTPNSLKNYLGLQSPWIPLRKLHKDSCLRFLNPSEMVTPALWTFPFLSSGVAMRHSGVRRLYVTQRDSYIQHLGDHSSNWTWQKLRQLPRVYPDQPSFNHTPEADAHEPCWEFDERLDPPQESIHSSFASLEIQSVPHQDDEDFEPASPSDHFSSAAVSPVASTTPTSVGPPPGLPLSPLKERNPFRPIHTRTTSMPTLVPIKVPQPSKRRIASFEQESQSSPSRAPSTSALNLNLKRRRISRSPSRPRDTPRYSVGPPSPYTFFDEIGQRDGKRERGMTPFAYATPHSNAPYVEASRPRSGVDVYVDDEDEDGQGSTTDNAESGYEANALSDYDSDGASDQEQERQVDDEWEGVQDEGLTTAYESRTIGKAIGGGLRREHEDDEGSEASSQPSEYPSTQQPEGLGTFSGPKTEFKIHVDEEDGV